jgi:hypothetical protein
LKKGNNWVDASYDGSLFVILWTFCRVYYIQMPQTHCKIINLTNIWGLKLPTWIKIFIKGWNSINIHKSYSLNFKNGHMDNNIGFTLVFKCILYYDFISIFYIGIQYTIHDEKKKELQQKL